MKIIITKKQLNLLNESRIHGLDHLYDSLILKLKKIDYIPGENLGYNIIRRIGKYLQDKDLIHEIIVKSIYEGKGRPKIYCRETTKPLIPS